MAIDFDIEDDQAEYDPGEHIACPYNECYVAHHAIVIQDLGAKLEVRFSDRHTTEYLWKRGKVLRRV